MLAQILGIGIILVALIDVYLTVLYPRTHKSVMSLKLCKSTWEIFRYLSRVPIRGSDKILSYCGPTLLILIVFIWVCSLILGFALLIWPTLGSGIQASQGQTPTDFSTALYYSGFTLTTLGVGDLVPKTNLWRSITIIESALGFTVFTASLTYLLSVYNALTKRNTFALSLFHRSGSEADAGLFLAQLKGYDRFETAFGDISSISRDLLFLLESHHAYPILHYFRFQEVQYSLARIALVSLDLATLIKTILHPQEYGPFINSSAVNELENSGLDLLFQLSDSFLGQDQCDQPAFEKEWRSRYLRASSLLQNYDVKTIPDLAIGADEYVARRRQWNGVVLAFANYMDYRWSNIVNPETEKFKE
ncbi:potassium channel family protein [Sphaerothrix gracilis]|uniref:potassium channel family protein n=1 Tax=Sphaerothrix gracilis TaxID=3151835 RepID=UPI0031FD8BA8